MPALELLTKGIRSYQLQRFTSPPSRDVTRATVNEAAAEILKVANDFMKNPWTHGLSPPPGGAPAPADDETKDD
ncbi:hypothetical protein H310_15038 [Aphanomyces invadans]|uniref:Uncharacterized protein n=1 Tax=Aphanomyces invadans TaxID=157072 RepID=A0A024T869_9STRA|nr:hypothetical protein H310_15038 [Aphanomyces invadans]ETV90129.1 hypothetical protein H310_15038 [Aphanomyces invadans]|eukprot:XP_008881238.1 hypothetical protein H310_15038 [Aphanomyces invadans]